MRRKKMWKKTMTVTLLAAMLLSLPQVTLLAETESAVLGMKMEETQNEEVEEISLLSLEAESQQTAAENFTYEENTDETITITGYSGNDKMVAIPEQIDGKNVTGIGNAVFERCFELTSIIIPEGVTSIGDSAFSDCINLTDISIPKGVTNIGKSTFAHCSRLTNVSIPEGVTSIGDSAFCYCKSLRSISIPKGVTNIEKSTFAHCSNLISVDISEGVTSIGDSAFWECSSLEDIIIPGNVKKIEEFAFWDCNNLKSVSIHEGVTSIARSVFRGCSSLTSLNIPKSVTDIGGDLCDGCVALETITVEEGNEFYYSGQNNCIIEKKRNSLIVGCKTTTIPQTVKIIDFLAFGGCSGLTSLDIPDGVTRIGENAFFGCSGLTSINIPQTVTDIIGNTFAYCSSLTSIVIPDGVTNLGEGAFYDCSSLTSITIPKSVKSIGVAAFSNCTKLTINTMQDSYAQQYAIENNIPYRLLDVCYHENTQLCNVKSVTCTEAGYTGDICCVDCGTCISKGTEIAALGHAYTESVTKQPTEKAEGMKTYTCSRCKNSYTQKIAKLKTSAYTVMFNGNGSTSGKTKKLSGCKYGKKYTLTKNGFKKTGYTFIGWNTKKDGKGTAYKNKAQIKNLTSKSDGKVMLYAQWKKIKYKITYKLNKGMNNKKNPTSYTITTKTITLKKPSRKGYTFKGWYLDKNCTKKVTVIKKGSTGQVTLYAKWEKNKI